MTKGTSNNSHCLGSPSEEKLRDCRVKEFNNKIALITGGSSGIGRATAIAFAHKGAKVVIASRRAEESEETIQLVKAVGSEAIFVKTDVKKMAEVEGLITKTVDNYGRLDFAFNNAGIEGQLGLSIDQTEENWNNVIDTNLKGTWLSMKYQISQMLRQGSGVIVNNASIAGLKGTRNTSIYNASKHGVIGLTKSLALEYAQAGIRINAVCPGLVETEMLDRLFVGSEETKTQRLAAYPMGRAGKPKEVADAVVWLCSDAASFMTGQSLVIDGGFTAG